MYYKLNMLNGSRIWQWNGLTSGYVLFSMMEDIGKNNPPGR